MQNAFDQVASANAGTAIGLLAKSVREASDAAGPCVLGLRTGRAISLGRKVGLGGLAYGRRSGSALAAGTMAV